MLKFPNLILQRFLSRGLRFLPGLPQVLKALRACCLFFQLILEPPDSDLSQNIRIDPVSKQYLAHPGSADQLVVCLLLKFRRELHKSACGSFYIRICSQHFYVFFT